MLRKCLKNELKCILHNKSILWINLVFPFVLAAFFYAISYNQEHKRVQTPIGVAVSCENEAQWQDVIHVLRYSTNQEQRNIFTVTIVPLEIAREMLANHEVDAYLYLTDHAELYINELGTRQKTIESYIKELKKYQVPAENTTKRSIPFEQFIVDTNQKFIRTETRKDLVTNGVIYYYALIGLTCILSAQLGIKMIRKLQANQSILAVRLTSAPVRKFVRYLAAFTANYCYAYVVCVALLLFLKYILAVPIAIREPFPYIICAAGVLCGIQLGMAIGIICYRNRTFTENLSVGMIIIFGFLSGLLRPDVKYYMSNQYPVLMKLNPVELVSDTFYSIYYYGDIRTALINFLILLGISIFLLLISLVGIRRNTYDSI